MKGGKKNTLLIAPSPARDLSYRCKATTPAPRNKTAGRNQKAKQMYVCMYVQIKQGNTICSCALLPSQTRGDASPPHLKTLLKKRNNDQATLFPCVLPAESWKDERMFALPHDTPWALNLVRLKHGRKRKAFCLSLAKLSISLSLSLPLQHCLPPTGPAPGRRQQSVVAAIFPSKP